MVILTHPDRGWPFPPDFHKICCSGILPVEAVWPGDKTMLVPAFFEGVLCEISDQHRPEQWPSLPQLCGTARPQMAYPSALESNWCQGALQGMSVIDPEPIGQAKTQKSKGCCSAGAPHRRAMESLSDGIGTFKSKVHEIDFQRFSEDRMSALHQRKLFMGFTSGNNMLDGLRVCSFLEIIMQPSSTFIGHQASRNSKV